MLIMKKTIYLVSCSVLILSTFVVVYDFVILKPRMTTNYSISILSQLTNFFFLPAIYFCLGLLFSISFMKKIENNSIVKWLSRISFAYLFLYCLLVFVTFSFNYINQRTWLLLALICNHSFVFVIPGIFLGLGLNKRI